MRNAQAQSNTTNEFLSRLEDIMAEIKETVPEIQQRNLLKVTATMYYLAKETDLLLKEGVLPVNWQYVRPIRLRSGSEHGNNSLAGLGDLALYCPNWLNVIWSVALSEPTPYGEAIATTITLGYAVYTIYCMATLSSTNNVDCSSKYSECINSGSMPSWKCYDCLRYCQGQHVWDCPRPY
jgi:hypothetical protein